MIEAIEIANAHLLEATGCCGNPKMVQLIRSPGKVRRYSVMYGAEVFEPDRYNDSSVSDGGEYILDVDATTGVVTRFVM